MNCLDGAINVRFGEGEEGGDHCQGFNDGVIEFRHGTKVRNIAMKWLFIDGTQMRGGRRDKKKPDNINNNNDNYYYEYKKNLQTNKQTEGE